MSNILPFKRPKPAEKHKGKFLCQSGHHKWQIDQERKFDVKQGRLVTLYRCARCTARKTEVI
ncbi:MAG: hypothetical protein OEY06_00515 [Gammaproteobacteria bacterium]|nr:hypothetical protein [Gammaproteobacteria bacterium]